MILLTPGPCMTSDAVRLAGAAPDLNHRAPEYADLIREIRGRLSDFTGGMHPHLIGGSGSAALEAMASSLVVKGPVLILASGYYSDRMDQIFAIHQIPHRTLKFPWMTGWDMATIETALNEAEYEWVVMCHHETTTSILNPVAQVAKMARSKGVKVMVDAMSSFGGDFLDFSNIDAVAASANKCLHGLPGVGFVLTREPAPDNPPRTYYLHLPLYAGESPPHTAPVPALLSFRQALREFEFAERHAGYQAKSKVMRDGLRAKGYQLPISDDVASSALTLAPIPTEHSYDSWFEFNLNHGYVIYGCKGELAEKYFQASVMGEVTSDMIAAWIDILPTWTA